MSFRLLSAVFVVLILACGPTVFADPGQCTEVYYWDPATDFDTSGPCCVYKVHNPDYGGIAFDWDYLADDPEHPYTQVGEVPVSDPIVNQMFRNRTTAVWTDWHIAITGGFITTAMVYNANVPDPAWWIHDSVANADGYTEIAFWTVSGSETFVPQGGILQVYFEYEAYAPIPEPTSLLALLTGLGGVLGISRRRR